MRLPMFAVAAFLVAIAPAHACSGCGCRGGPGYRGPDGKCVGYKDLAKKCGNPPTERCTMEKAK